MEREVATAAPRPMVRDRTAIDFIVGKPLPFLVNTVLAAGRSANADEHGTNPWRHAGQPLETVTSTDARSGDSHSALMGNSNAPMNRSDDRWLVRN